MVALVGDGVELTGEGICRSRDGVALSTGSVLAHFIAYSVYTAVE